MNKPILYIYGQEPRNRLEEQLAYETSIRLTELLRNELDFVKVIRPICPDGRFRGVLRQATADGATAIIYLKQKSVEGGRLPAPPNPVLRSSSFDQSAFPQIIFDQLDNRMLSPAWVTVASQHEYYAIKRGVTVASITLGRWCTANQFRQVQQFTPLVVASLLSACRIYFEPFRAVA